MSRHRDYQPTIDRARSQAEIACSREAKLRDKADDNHREMLRQKAAARIAGEEADALRDEVARLEQSNADLRRSNAGLRLTLDNLTPRLIATQAALARAETPWWRRLLERAASFAETAA